MTETPTLRVQLWAVAQDLTVVYPTRRNHLIRVVVEVAYRATVRVQPADPDPRPAAVLGLVRRWLDGEPISGGRLHAAATDAAYAAYDAYDDCAWAAHSVGVAAGYAAYADAAGDAGDSGDAYARHARGTAASAAADAADAAAVCAADSATERAQQAKDLDELLAALRLEVRGE